MKKKNMSTDKIVQNIKTPGGFSRDEISRINRSSHPSNGARERTTSRERKIKYMKKVKMLAKFQSQMVQTVL